MPREFHNPYHFIPVKNGAGQALRQQDAPVADLPAHVGHDRYAAGTHSGKIVCKLTTKTPVLNGGGQTKGDYNHKRRVQSFRNGTELAASSLRGMIGSLIEAASNSAMRILDADRLHSFRKPAQGAHTLSAIGMVIAINGRYRLIPFCPPTIERPANGPADRWLLPAKWHTVFTRADFKVYLGGSRREIEQILPQQDWFQTYVHADDEARRGRVYGLQLSSPLPVENGRIDHDNWWHVKRGGNREFLLAQLAADDHPKPVRWDRIPAGARGEYVPGLVRVLGCQGRSDMPNTKKHELFLPLPPKMGVREDGFLEFGDPKRLPIPDAVRERFEALADERTEENDKFPYEPHRTARGGTADKPKALRLKTGDLVYFDVNATGTEVSEISFSSIWRGSAGSTKQFFEDFNDPNLLPISPKRTQATIAEQMLGFVDNIPKGMKADRARALASRLRFTDASLKPGQTDTWYQQGQPVTLRILDSPKPPSPSFYFENNGQAIPKPSLQVGVHRPQGRKQYLHDRGNATRPEPFRTKLEAQDVQEQGQRADSHSGGWTQFTEAVRLLRPELEYTFEVRFDNLSRAELALLVYALSPAEGDAFWHKLGLGKSIGLGSVKVDIASIDLVERAKRYTASGFIGERYAPTDPQLTAAALREETRAAMDGEIRQAIELLGNPAKVVHPVHVPSMLHHYHERDTYEWFVKNEHPHSQRQQLKPLRMNANALPTLKTWEP